MEEKNKKPRLLEKIIMGAVIGAGIGSVIGASIKNKEKKEQEAEKEKKGTLFRIISLIFSKKRKIIRDDAKKIPNE